MYSLDYACFEKISDWTGKLTMKSAIRIYIYVYLRIYIYTSTKKNALVQQLCFLCVCFFPANHIIVARFFQKTCIRPVHYSFTPYIKENNHKSIKEKTKTTKITSQKPKTNNKRTEHAFTSITLYITHWK